MRASAKALGSVATLGAALAFGTSFAVNDAGLRALDPFTFAFLRFVLGAASCLALAALFGGVAPRLARDPRVWALGALNGAAYALQYVGQCWTTPARTALFVNSNVFIVALLSYFFLRERFGAGKVAAVVVAFVGVGLLSVQQGNVGPCGVAWWGDALVFGASVVWAFYVVLAGATMTRPGVNVLAVAGWSFVATAVVLAPFLLLDEAPLAVPREGWGPIVYAGLVTTTLAYALWNWGLTRVSATASVVILLLEVPIAVAISLAVGRESFTPLSVAGALVLFAAVAYVSFSQAAVPPERP